MSDVKILKDNELKKVDGGANNNIPAAGKVYQKGISKEYARVIDFDSLNDSVDFETGVEQYVSNQNIYIKITGNSTMSVYDFLAEYQYQSESWPWYY